MNVWQISILDDELLDDPLDWLELWLDSDKELDSEDSLLALELLDELLDSELALDSDDSELSLEADELELD